MTFSRTIVPMPRSSSSPDQEVIPAPRQSPIPLTEDEIAVALQYPEPPQMSEAERTGLIAAVGRRAGRSAQLAAIRLAQGWPRNMAVVGSGMTWSQLRDLCKRDSIVDELMLKLEEAGFAGKTLKELYDRAHAGKDDRGSLRALEMIVKARAPEYQEKYSVEHHLRQEGEKSLRLGAGGGWQERGDAGQFEASDGQ